MKTYLCVDQKELDPKKDPWSSFDILASIPEMKKAKLHGGISGSRWNLSEEEGRRRFAGADCGLFRHDYGLELANDLRGERYG